MDDKPAVRGKPNAVLREFEHLTSIVRRRTPIPKSSGMHFKSTGDTPEVCVSGTIPPIYVNFRLADFDRPSISFPTQTEPKVQRFTEFQRVDRLHNHAGRIRTNLSDEN